MIISRYFSDYFADQEVGNMMNEMAKIEEALLYRVLCWA